MKTEQVNLRLETELVEALERVAEAESVDRGTLVRRLLKEALANWRVERALRLYQDGALSLGRAAEDAELSQWEIVDLIEKRRISYPLEAGDVRKRLARGGASGEAGSTTGFTTRLEWMGQMVETLEDVAPSEGGILLVGINPALRSVAAGHYYQGRLGQRLWKRLERAGLLADPMPGREDEAWAQAGNGLTDLVKRATVASSEITSAELHAGVDLLIEKIRSWKPGLVLFPFKKTAAKIVGPALSPGPGPLLEGVPTFLLPSPYASAETADEIGEELRRLAQELPTWTGT